MFVMFVICITMIWPAWYDHLTMTGLVSGAEVSLASVASEMHARKCMHSRATAKDVEPLEVPKNQQS